MLRRFKLELELELRGREPSLGAIAAVCSVVHDNEKRHKDQDYDHDHLGDGAVGRWGGWAAGRGSVGKVGVGCVCQRYSQLGRRACRPRERLVAMVALPLGLASENLSPLCPQSLAPL